MIICKITGRLQIESNFKNITIKIIRIRITLYNNFDSIEVMSETAGERKSVQVEREKEIERQEEKVREKVAERSY